MSNYKVSVYPYIRISRILRKIGIRIRPSGIRIRFGNSNGDNEVPGKKLSTKEPEGINQDLRLQNSVPISKDKAKLSSTDQGPKRSIKGPVMTKGHIPIDQCSIRQGIHQGRALTKSGPSHRTQHLDPCLLGQILEDGE